MSEREILAYDTKRRPIYSDEDEWYADTPEGYLWIEDKVRYTDVYDYIRDEYTIKHASEIAREVYC